MEVDFDTRVERSPILLKLQLIGFWKIAQLFSAKKRVIMEF